ncbi:MAG: hypothetical protein PVSMB4_07740 [Ktedonobacterales bacterium]
MDSSGSAEGTTPLACSVGIMAHNEGANIASAIEAILRQSLTTSYIAEVIVVASGCTDQTVPIVAGLARTDARVRLLVQAKREGKAAAINLFLGAARSPILVMASADVLLKDGALDMLLQQFQDPAVGMVGAHPIPVNDDETLLGYAVHLLWRLHDRVSREAPKLGEVVAFRNVIPSIPLDTPVDEISIQALVTQLGYKLVYEPRAVVYNRGPATISDYLRQRRRIHAGHLKIRQQQGYTASTMSVWRVGRALLAERPFTTARMAQWTIATAGLEVLARILGKYDYLSGRQHHIWSMAATTKLHVADDALEQAHQSVLVFRILSFHQRELELGAHPSRLLMQQVAQHVRSVLGESGTVSTERSGTIIALLPVEREDAERIAQQIIQTIESQPLHVAGQRGGISVRLACGIIAFPQAGGALALSFPEAI